MFLNLFSIFDPNTNIYYSMNWMSIFIPLIIYPKMFWFKNSKMFFFNKFYIMFLFNELNNLMNKKNFNNIMIFMSMFFIILFMNLMGLYPYIFTPTSHLIITLPLSLTIWMSIMIFNWTKMTNKSFSHLIPLGTPTILMPFMVIIETISNIIRPGTLAIRLSANMIAGHLLICLLGNTGYNLIFIILIILIFIQILLYSLELSVSIIQAYVFMTLSSLYSNEI